MIQSEKSRYASPFKRSALAVVLVLALGSVGVLPAHASSGTIDFLPNGGSGEPSDSALSYNAYETLTLPTVGTLAKSGFKFLGWRKDQSVRTYQRGGSSYTVTDESAGDFNMYATWGRTVIFDSNGGTVGGDPANKTWIEGEASVTIHAPGESEIYKRGFDHIGWSTVSYGATLVPQVFVPTLPEQTLYAVWRVQPTRQTFLIDFRPNKKTLAAYSVGRLNQMTSLLDPDAVFPKKKVVVFLQSKRFVTQSSALGMARIKYVRRALKEAGVKATVVWSNETRSGGTAKPGKNNRVIAKLRWVN